MRAFFLRFLGAKIGRRVRIEKVTFIQIQYPVANLSCADDVFIGSGVILDLSSPIRLEEHVIIAPGCSILTHQDFGDFNGNILSSVCGTKYLPVHLKRNAVVGADSTVLAGSVIGRYSIVAAKSLVQGEIPEMVLVAGVPAKVAKHHSDLLLAKGVS